MKYIHKAVAVVAVSVFLFSCSGDGHFITNAGYRSLVEHDFEDRMSFLSAGTVCHDAVDQVRSTMDMAENAQQREALEFLYAYMPLGDMADYDGRLWLEGVKTAFTAREEMPWGGEIPEDVFRHFVLPLRVNNENLDSARTVFYRELRDRVKDMEIYGAILEVNHWCHEKVSYAPSDARTSAPLATMKTSLGRCGEESVFCVSALRAVGIPARQVYTPRWAHTDDNHAWVEVWADGRWHYIGACEPEPRLDVAWFSSTATRGLLMHTKAFGRYEDDDADVISRTACYTELNVTSNYVPVGRVDVQVVDRDNVPVRDARTEFKIYNYAEFYPAITSFTDEDGRTGATFGYGDVLVWASKGDMFGYAKANPGALSGKQKPGFLRSLLLRLRGPRTNAVKVILDRHVGDPFEEELDIVPPEPTPVETTLSERETEINKVRLAYEDSVRTAYVSTFPRGDRYTVSAFGNWEEIESFIFFNSSTPEHHATAERMLDLLNAKDLRDTPCDVLMDHVTSYYRFCDPSPAQSDYLLNPRIANEMLTPYREGLRSRYGDSLSIEGIISIVCDIKVMDEQNPAGIPITPLGVARAGAADSRSRDIFFVAMCRTYGVPARLDPVDSDPQYWAGGHWTDLNARKESSPKGRLYLTYQDRQMPEDPKYEIHFTLSGLDSGSPVLLNFTDSEGIEGTATWSGVFRDGITLDAGCYLLTTGSRMAGGKVLSTVTVFNVPENGSVRVPLTIRQSVDELQVIGSMNAEDIITVLSEDADSLKKTDASILSVTGRGYFVLCFVRPSDEPSSHSIRSLLSEPPRFPAIILFQSEGDYRLMNRDTFPEVPENVHFAVCPKLMDSICRELGISDPEMPLTVVADTFGRIVYVTQGYNIGLSEQLQRL